MAGEMWRGSVQVGLESAWGTEVDATRILYCREPTLTRTREPRIHKYMTTTRNTTRNISLGPTQVSGNLVMPVSAEIIEFLLMGVKKGVTAVGASTTKTWTFTPGNELDSATIEWHDGATAWTATGCMVNSLKFAGSVSGENLCTAEIFGKDMEPKALKTGLPHRVPAIFEGWETALAIDALGATPGTTAVTGTLLDWDVTLTNGLTRKYFAANTLNIGGLSVGELEVKAELTFEAAAAQSTTEYSNWDGVTHRLLRLTFGNNAKIGAGPDKEMVTVDLPGAWTAVDLGGSDEGTRTYKFSLQGIYDPTNAFGLQIVVTTARATAWA